MKYFFSSLFFVFCFIILTFALFSANANSFNRSKDDASAFNDSISTLTWYGANNQLIYNVDVPYGYSLNDLQNANLVSSTDSYFDTFNTTSVGSGLNGFALSNNATFDINSKIFTFPNRYSVVRFLVQDDISSYIGKRVYFKFDIDNIISSKILYAQIFYYYSGGSSSISSITFSDNGVYVLSGVIPSNAIYFDCRVIVYDIITSPSTFTLKYYYVGTEDLPYFNFDYVNHLYVNSGGVISSDYVWSMSKVNTIVYDSSLINNVSASFYYIKDRPVISLVDSFGTMFRDISNLTNSFTTYTCLQNLKSTFNNFNNMDFNFNSSHKKDFGYGITTINVLGYVSDLVQYVIMWLLNICKLVFFAISLLVCPLIDSVSLLFYLFSGVDLWFYFS